MAYLGYRADMAYLDADQSREVLSQLGFTIDDTEHFFESKDTDAQGFIIGDNEKIILAFRGTEKLADWATNLDLDQEIWPPTKPLGRLHCGFYTALRSVWPTVTQRLQQLQANNQPIWITGHSLGGALAAIACATLRLQADPPAKVMGAYTFGQPRVGDARLARSFDADFKDHFFRVVNNNDSVCRIPPLEYEPMGSLVYFDADGALQLDQELSVVDRLSGFGDAVTRLDFDNVGDHRMGDYRMLSMRHL